MFAFVFVTACDFGGGSGMGCGGDGCVRIHQGDYTFPVKRIIPDSLRLRVTQGGLDFITDRVKELVFTFFDADENGNAVIALDALGLGDLGTSLGPFSGSVGGLVLSLNLNSLEVDLIPGSTPAQLRIRATDVEVGIVSGYVFGAYDGILVDGDAECQLASGPSGHVALLSFDLVLSLDTDPGGVVFVDVVSLNVDTQNIDLDIQTDCSVPACSDGLPPQCAECTALCGAASLASSLVTFVQDIFDDLVDDLVSFIADDIANLLLDLVFNGQPLAVEGTLDYGPLLAPIVPYLASAAPLGIAGRPGGESFAINGGFGNQGLDVTLDAGVETPGAGHPCVGQVGTEPVFQAGTPPEFPAVLPDGSSYEVGLAVSEALINETLWALYKGGALCIDVTTRDIDELTGGALDLRSATLDLLLPGIVDLAGSDAPVRLRLRPTISNSAPDLVGFSDVDGETRLDVTLPAAQIGIEVLYADHYLRAIAFRADVRLSVALDALPDARISLRVADVTIDNTTVEDNEIFANARMDLIVPFMVDTVLGLLGDIPLEFELPTAGLASGLGLPLDVVVRDITASGPMEDWLVAYIGLLDAPDPLAAQPIIIDRVRPGQLVFEAPYAESNDHELQLRIGHGQWSRWFSGPGPHTLEHPRLWLLAEHRVQTRARRVDEAAGPAADAGTVTVTRPEPVAAVHAETHVHRSGTKADQGCDATGDNGTPLGLWLVAALLMGVTLRRRVWSWAVVLLALGGCAGDATPGDLRCTYHDQCPGGWMCGLDNTCVPEVGCGVDADCCPGATCFNNWCRPTSFCDLGEQPARPCYQEGFACELPWNAEMMTVTAEGAAVAPGTDGGWCAPQTCEAHADCPGGLRCTAGRCLGASAIPCDGGCTADEACHLPSGRCLAATNCQACTGDELRVVAPSSALTALSCGADLVECSCAPPPEPPTGRPGREPQLALSGDTALVVSYEPVYGDLVLTRAPVADLADQSDVAVDGLPGEVGNPLDGYRGGAFEPGPDRGARPSMQVIGNQVHAIHQDRDLDKARYTRSSSDGAVEASFELPIPGIAGRYSCVTVEPGGDNPVALVFVESDQGKARLIQARATSATPSGPEDFVFTPVLERDLPEQSSAPCADACGPLDVCVVANGAQSCASVFDSLSCTGTTCPAHHICATVEEGVEPTCLPRVYRTPGGDDVPFGTGLFVTCAANANQAVAAFYDRDVGALYSLDWPWVSATPTLVDGTEAAWDAPDVGAHADVALSPVGPGSGIAYWDATAGALKFADRPGPAGTWDIVTVHEGATAGSTADLGAWASASYSTSGDPVVGYADAGRANVNVASRSGSGCWKTTEVLATGGYVTPDIATTVDGNVVIAARELIFDEQLRPRHSLVLTTIPRPVCSGR